MIPADETFDGTWPFAPRFSTAAGFRMHYVDEGPRDRPPILCLHGEPTWGYLYRKFIPPLARSHRVIVPDHMGFGKSETPADREYTLRTHVENLTALVEELDLRDLTLVIQDWGGPIGGAFAVRHPERVKRLCLMNTLLGYGGPIPPMDTPWFRFVARGLEDGSFEAVLGNLGDTILSVMKLIGLEHTAVVDDTWVRAYAGHFRTRADCQGALEFPRDIFLGRIAPYVMEGFAGVEALKRKPAMLAFGLRDRAIPAEVALGDFRALFPKGPIVELADAGHFCQEDAPETLVALIRQFVQMTD